MREMFISRWLQICILNVRLLKEAFTLIEFYFPTIRLKISFKNTVEILKI